MNASAPVIPDHTLLCPIGRGAYGEVWLAKNIMGALRAVKLIHRRGQGDRAYEREFAGIQRYEPVSRSSGGLVHVLQVGRNDAEGYFYYVMELADPVQPGSILNAAQSTPPTGAGGPDRVELTYRPRTLRSDVNRLERLNTADCVQLGLEVVSGLAQLHAHGLVHRDVKPGNIIYANGRAKLADIGLVAAHGEGRTFVGTEGYIPPEGPGSAAADIYALGVVLYEASTGFAPESFPDVPPDWLMSEQGDDALEFHEIVLKACEAQPARRYQSAQEMQADLALLQSGQSVRQMRALARRHARLKITGVIGTTLLVCAVGIAWFSSYRAGIEAQNRAQESALRRLAERSQDRAEKAEHEAREQLNTALYEQARALVLSKEIGHRARALKAIRGAIGGGNLPELRRVAFAALSLPDLRLVGEVPLAPEQTLAQVDRSFERVALGQGTQSVTICSLPSMAVEATLPPSRGQDAYVARWSRDGRYLAVKRQHDVLGTDSDLELWDLKPAPRLLRVLSHVAFGAFSFHPLEAKLLVGRTDGVVSVCDLENGMENQALESQGNVHAVSYSLKGDRVAVCWQRTTNSVLAIYAVADRRMLQSVDCPEPAEQLVWHPQERWLSTVGESATDWNRAVRLIDTVTGHVTVLGRHKIKVATVEFTSDGDYLMSTGWDRELICWNLQMQERVFSLAGAGYSLTWRRDDAQCALIAPTLPTERLQFYSFERPACRELAPLSSQAGLGVFSQDGRWLAVPDTKQVCVWDLANGVLPMRLPTAGNAEVFFSADSSTLFALTGPMGEAQLRAWHVTPEGGGNSPPACVPVRLVLPARLNGAALSPKELVLTSAEGVRFLPLADLTQAAPRIVSIPSGKGITSGNGRWLAMTYPFSPVVTVYRLPELDKVATLNTSDSVARVSFTPGNDELAVINRAGLEWWDTSTWRLKRRQPGSPVADSYLLDMPDRSALWKVTDFRDTGLFNRETLAPILPLPKNVVPLALSSDGEQLAVSVDDQRIQLWRLNSLRAELRSFGLDWKGPR